MGWNLRCVPGTSPNIQCQTAVANAEVQILVQPVIADAKMVEGLNYIISRMEWYMELSEVIFEDDWEHNVGLSQLQKTLQGSIAEIYAALMEYEMMSVAYYFRDSPFTRTLTTLLSFNNWEERTETIKQLEGDFYRSNLQYDNREIVQQLRSQRRDQLERNKAERRKR